MSLNIICGTWSEVHIEENALVMIKVATVIGHMEGLWNTKAVAQFGYFQLFLKKENESLRVLNSCLKVRLENQGVPMTALKEIPPVVPHD